MFGDDRRTEISPWNAHRIYVNTSDPALRERMEARGYHPQPARRGTWKLGWSNLDYGATLRLAEEISRAGQGLDMALSAFLTDTQTPGGVTRKYDLHPASHIHPGMVVPVHSDGRIEDDEVTEVRWDAYAGQVYDLDVDKVHTYIANGIVVHNSIYGWRGADPRNIKRLRDDFPDMRQVLLERNYRSTQIILDAANEVIKHNWGRTPKTLFTDRAGGPLVTVYQAYDEVDEANFVVDEIARLSTQGSGAPQPSDCVILYRTNAQSRALEDAFVRRNLPYRLVGATRFYERKEIKDAIAYLRLVHNPNDSLSLARIINEPPRRIGKASETALVQWAAQMGLSQTEALRVLAGERGELASRCLAPQAMDEAPFGGAAKAALLGFWRLLAGWIGAKHDLTVGQLLDRLLEELGYSRYLRDGTEEGEGRWENLQELRTVTASYVDLPAGEGLAAFLEEVASGQRQRRAARGAVGADADDAAHGQGAGVPGGLHGRHGGGRLPPQPQQGRPRPHGRGAPAGLRRHHARQAAPLPGACLPPHPLRIDRDLPAQPVFAGHPQAPDQRPGHAGAQRASAQWFRHAQLLDQRASAGRRPRHRLEPIAPGARPAGRPHSRGTHSPASGSVQGRPAGQPRHLRRGRGDQDRAGRRRRVRQRGLPRQGHQEADGQHGQAADHSVVGTCAPGGSRIRQEQ